jgi:hypothetical protein
MGWQWFSGSAASGFRSSKKFRPPFLHGGFNLGLLEYMDYQEWEDLQWREAYLCKVEGQIYS